MGISAYERAEKAGELPEDVCETCHGSKLVTISNYDGNGSDADDQPCPDCQEPWGLAEFLNPLSQSGCREDK